MSAACFGGHQALRPDSRSLANESSSLFEIGRINLTEVNGLENAQTGQHFGVFENASEGIDAAYEFTEHIYSNFWQQRSWRGTAPFHRRAGERPWWASLADTEPLDPDNLDCFSSQDRDDYVRQNYKTILKKISQLTTSDRTESDIFPVETWQQWLNDAFHHETDHPVELYKHLQRPVREYVELSPLVPYLRHVETLLQRGRSTLTRSAKYSQCWPGITPL